MTVRGAGRQAAPRLAKWGWSVLIAVAAALVLNGVVLYFGIAENDDTRTIAILLTGVGLLATMAALDGFRRGSRWAWNSTWTLVAVLAALVAQIDLAGDEREVSVAYLVMGAVALVGQLLAGTDRRQR